MKSDAIAFGIAGVVLGLLAGWIIGSQQATLRQPLPAVAQQPAAASAGSASQATRAAVLDESQVNALKSVAEREPRSAAPRARLGNLYFDAGQYDAAIQRWQTVAKAKQGDVTAAKVLLSYVVGKPAPAPDPDRLTVEEVSRFRDPATEKEDSVSGTIQKESPAGIVIKPAAGPERKIAATRVLEVEYPVPSFTLSRDLRAAPTTAARQK